MKHGQAHKTTRSSVFLHVAPYSPVQVLLNLADKGDVCFETSVICSCVPLGKVDILGGHSIGHSKQQSVYVHESVAI
jgi:hypothetical protein